MRLQSASASNTKENNPREATQPKVTTKINTRAGNTKLNQIASTFVQENLTVSSNHGMKNKTLTAKEKKKEEANNVDSGRQEKGGSD